MVMEAVKNFMETHNRPFSINEIIQGVKDFGKAAVQEALNTLIDEGRIKEKVYGKQKIYCIIQENNACETALRESLLEMDRKINEGTLQLTEVSDKLKSHSAVMVQMKGKLTLQEALVKKLKLEKELEEIKSHVEEYSGKETICPEVRNRAEADYERNLNEYKKRKRMCNEILNSILENYPNTKKHLYDQVGIETDEDAGFSIDTL